MPILPFKGYDLSGYETFSRAIQHQRYSQAIQERLRRARQEMAEGRITGYKEEEAFRKVPSKHYTERARVFLEDLFGIMPETQEEIGAALRRRQLARPVMQKYMRREPIREPLTPKRREQYKTEAIEDIIALGARVPREMRVDPAALRGLGLTHEQRMQMIYAKQRKKPWYFYITTKKGEQVQFTQKGFKDPPAAPPRVTNENLKRFGIKVGDIDWGRTRWSQQPYEQMMQKLQSAESQKVTATMNTIRIINAFADPNKTLKDQQSMMDQVRSVLEPGQKIELFDPVKGRGPVAKWFLETFGSKKKRYVIKNADGSIARSTFGLPEPGGTQSEEEMYEQYMR